jgi:hypothetical protein
VSCPTGNSWNTRRGKRGRETAGHERTTRNGDCTIHRRWKSERKPKALDGGKACICWCDMQLEESCLLIYYIIQASNIVRP